MTGLLADCRIIVVTEDEPSAADLTITLEAAGATVICADSARGVVLIERPFLSAVVLDSGPSSWDRRTIVRRLQERRVPFVFYGLDPPTSEHGAPYIAKPAPPEDVAKLLSALIEGDNGERQG